MGSEVGSPNPSTNDGYLISRATSLNAGSVVVELWGKDALFILLATAAHYMCALLRYAKVPSRVRLPPTVVYVLRLMKELVWSAIETRLAVETRQRC